MVIPALERVKIDQNRHNLSSHIFFVRVLPLGKKKKTSHNQQTCLPVQS